MKKLVILTGAGISAESGIKTFREAGGLWEEHDIYEVASPIGWAKDPELVLNFYNERRKGLMEVEPNEGHKGLVELEQYFDVEIITQNVDDLHERAGCTKVLHLHGELFKVQSTQHPELVYEWKKDLHLGDKCDMGAQLRPFVVWFGEPVPMMEEAIRITSQADILVVVGTSLVVYPAAGLINYVRQEVPKFIVDPNSPQAGGVTNVEYIQEKATVGVPVLVNRLLKQFAG